MSFTQEYREIIEYNTFSPNFSLKQKGLAQARGFSRSGELLSPKRGLEEGNSGVVALSHLGETSSPK